MNLPGVCDLPVDEEGDGKEEDENDEDENDEEKAFYSQSIAPK